MEKRSYGMLVVAGLVALGAVGFAIFTTQQSSESIDTEQPVAVVGKSPTTTLGDADNDGVPDWKEILWGTDPENPDTDGDGVSDGDEIAAGVNPKKSGSDPVTSASYVAPKALTSSEALARELFAGYAQIKQGGTFDASQVDTVITNIINQNTPTTNSAPPLYSVTNLSIAKEDSASTRATYRSKVDAISLKTYAVPESELITVKKLLDTGDAVHINTLRSDAKIYRGIVQDLLKVPVPSSYATTHVTLINSFNATASAVMRLADSTNDSYEILYAVQNYLTVGDQLIAAYKNLYTVTKSK